MVSPLIFFGGLVQAETKQRWLELCQRAIVERDPGEFATIRRELTGLLEAKERRLTGVARTDTNCWMCGKPVTLETCSVDEHGRAVHEGCYASKLASYNQ